jgi:hypothetical protein
VVPIQISLEFSMDTRENQNDSAGGQIPIDSACPEIVSLLRIVRHSYRPHTGVLVRTETGVWQALPALPGTVTEPGMAVYRFGAPLFYANAGQFSYEISHLAAAGHSELCWVIVFAKLAAGSYQSQALGLPKEND